VEVNGLREASGPFGDPASVYAEYERMLAEGGRVQPTPAGWVFLRYADITALLRDSRWGRGSGDEELRAAEMSGRQRSFIRTDPPEHTRLRGLVAKAFSPKVIEGLRPRIQVIAGYLIDRALAQGEVDMIEAFNFPLPVTVICELLGIPEEDRLEFGDALRALARGEDPEQWLTNEEREQYAYSLRYFARYFYRLAARRRRQPGDDLVTRLVEVQEAGDHLTQGELLATCVLLLLAGHETTVNLIGNAVLALLRHPAQMELIREDRLPPGASWFDEVVRYDPPVQFMSRTALTDMEFAGMEWTKGTKVILLLAAANRDPEVFPNAAEFDSTRPNARRHVGFGMGIHFCLGAPLARLETEIAVQTLLRRAPGLSLAAEPTYKKNVVLRGLGRLPVKLG
jgi:cytochrome P450